VEDNPRDDDSLVTLASRIDENQPIDWEAAEEEARDEQERAVLAELRVLAALARVYRDPEGSGPVTEHDREPDLSQIPVTWRSLTILELVGSGGFARVFRARDTLGREVALKLFPVGRHGADDIAGRVLREGSLLAKVKHQNVVIVHGVDRTSDYVGLWMEFVSGRTMEEELRTRGTLSADEATTIGVDVCRALAAVHARGLLHRDVKAANVMREEGGRTVLMDFGAGSEQIVDGARPADLAGTPLYIAPEIFERQPATQAGDIYSLGVLLFRMVTGGYPVDGADRTEIARAHRKQRRRRLRDVRPDLPTEFVQVVERALAPNPAHRYQSAAELEEGLMRAAAARGRKKPWQLLSRGRAAAAVAAAVVLLAVPAWWMLRSDITDPARLATQGSTPSTASTAAAPVEPAAAPAAAPAASYKIKATFYRQIDGGQHRALLPGDRVAPDDPIGLEIEASAPLHVYVVSADDHGETYLLFPLEGYTPANPIPASKLNRLPGSKDGQETLWSVSSVGSREHLLLMASPEPLTAFEPMLKALPRPSAGKTTSYKAVPDSVVGQLRGIGGLVVTAPKNTRPTAPWFDATPISAEAESATGPWVRQLVLENRGR
jgi:hypothetical protein